MREFFKYVFATVVGFVISIVLVIIFCFIILAGIISTIGKDKKVETTANTVLFMNMDQAILERTPDGKFDNVPFLGSGLGKSIGFHDLIKALEKAKTDDNIKCIYLNVSAPMAGKATLKEVRDALLDFKKSKKTVLAYSELYNQDAYYLASAADKVYLNPQGLWNSKVSVLS